MEELWKDVPGYEGVYMASDFGNIKSLDREASPGKGNGFKSGRILKPSPDTNGYLIVGLYRNGKHNTRKVHSLVAESFLGHKPCGYSIVIDHKDNDKLNNRAVNLQLISVRENVSKDRRGGTSKYLGVCWGKREGKWRANIDIDGKTRYLGCFTDELEASKAYQKALYDINNP